LTTAENSYAVAGRALITGAFGNIGAYALREMIGRGRLVRCFDIRTDRNERVAREFDGSAEVVWGDISDPDDVRQAVMGCDRVLNLAAIIPPLSEENPERSRAVNVGGARNIISAARSQSPPVPVIQVSSIAVFGRTQHLPPPRAASDPVEATDNYTAQKIEIEKLVRESGLQWAILRLGASPPLNTLESSHAGRVNPMMFDVPLTDRIEIVHPADAGLAMANAAESDEIWGKTLLIGGGERCRLHQGEFLGQILDAVGIGRLPEEAFSKTPYHTDWLDTTESQELLQFQRLAFEDYLKDMVAQVGFRRHFIRLLRPIIRRAMLKHSPYLKAARG